MPDNMSPENPRSPEGGGSGGDGPGGSRPEAAFLANYLDNVVGVEKDETGNYIISSDEVGLLKDVDFQIKRAVEETLKASGRPEDEAGKKAEELKKEIRKARGDEQLAEKISESLSIIFPPKPSARESEEVAAGTTFQEPEGTDSPTKPQESGALDESAPRMTEEEIKRAQLRLQVDNETGRMPSDEKVDAKLKSEDTGVIEGEWEEIPEGEETETPVAKPRVTEEGDWSEEDEGTETVEEDSVPPEDLRQRQEQFLAENTTQEWTEKIARWYNKNSQNNKFNDEDLAIAKEWMKLGYGLKSEEVDKLRKTRILEESQRLYHDYLINDPELNRPSDFYEKLQFAFTKYYDGDQQRKLLTELVGLGLSQEKMASMGIDVSALENKAKAPKDTPKEAPKTEPKPDSTSEKKPRRSKEVELNDANIGLFRQMMVEQIDNPSGDRPMEYGQLENKFIRTALPGVMFGGQLEYQESRKMEAEYRARLNLKRCADWWEEVPDAGSLTKEKIQQMPTLTAETLKWLKGEWDIQGTGEYVIGTEREGNQERINLTQKTDQALVVLYEGMKGEEKWKFHRVGSAQVESLVDRVAQNVGSRTAAEFAVKIAIAEIWEAKYNASHPAGKVVNTADFRLKYSVLVPAIVPGGRRLAWEAIEESRDIQDMSDLEEKVKKGTIPNPYIEEGAGWAFPGFELWDVGYGNDYKTGESCLAQGTYLQSMRLEAEPKQVASPDQDADAPVKDQPEYNPQSLQKMLVAGSEILETMKLIGGEGKSFDATSLDTLNGKIQAAIASMPKQYQYEYKVRSTKIIAELTKTFFWAPSIANPDIMNTGLAERNAVPTTTIIKQFERIVLAVDPATGTGKYVGNYNPHPLDKYVRGMKIKESAEEVKARKDKALEVVDETMLWMGKLVDKSWKANLDVVSSRQVREQLGRNRGYFDPSLWMRPKASSVFSKMVRASSKMWGSSFGVAPSVEPWWFKK